MVRSFDASVYLQDCAKPLGIPEIALITLLFLRRDVATLATVISTLG
jgi:hypothetical protein